MGRGKTITYLKKRIDINSNKCYWPLKIHENKWFHFQDELMHTFENLTNKPNDVLLTPLLIFFFAHGKI